MISKSHARRETWWPFWTCCNLTWMSLLSLIVPLGTRRMQTQAGSCWSKTRETKLRSCQQPGLLENSQREASIRTARVLAWEATRHREGMGQEAPHLESELWGCGGTGSDTLERVWLLRELRLYILLLQPWKTCLQKEALYCLHVKIVLHSHLCRQVFCVCTKHFDLTEKKIPKGKIVFTFQDNVFSYIFPLPCLHHHRHH